MSRPENENCPLNEQAVGFTVHALEPEEEIAMLRHLPLCASCRAVVGDAEVVFTRLGAAVEQVDPPPSLKASLMARVAETPQVVVPTDAGTSRSEQESDDRTTATQPGGRSRRSTPSSRPEPARPPRSSWLSRRGRRLVAASVALVGVLAIGGLVTRTAQLEQQRDAEAAQSQSVTQLLEQLGRPGTQYALLAEDGGPTVAAVLVADGRRQVFSIGLPANTTDRDTYVLWGLGDTGDPLPLGTFDVPPADPGVRPVGSIPGANGFSKYAISIEPGRIAPAAPTKVVAIGDVTA